MLYAWSCLAGTSQLAAFSVVFNNLQEFMPPNTMIASNTSLESVGDLRYVSGWSSCVLLSNCVGCIHREKSEQLPRTSVVSLSIVETGERYSSSSAKLTLKEPVQINYTTVTVRSLYL